MWAGQPLSHPFGYARLKMNFQKQDDIQTEPWWVTILGCLAFAALLALALIAL